jgi:hypothetical protein
MFVTTTHLRRAYGLPTALARDIVAEAMQRVLRRRWQPWAWLLAWLMLPALAAGAGWFPTWHAVRGWALAALAVGCFGWAALAQWLGGEAMLAAAGDKARRLGRAP